MLDYFGVLEMRGILQRGWVSMPRWSAAARALAEDGSPEAAQVLAEVFVGAGSLQRVTVRAALLELVNPRAIEQVWAVWAALRCDALAEAYACRPLRLPCRVDLLVLSRLKLGLREELRRMVNRDVITELVRASADRDRVIAGSAASLLAEMVDHPLTVSVLSAALCSTRTPSAAARACQAALRGVRSVEAVDALCAAWAACRHPLLADLLDQRRLVASAPVDVALLTRLRQGLEPEPEHVAALLAACEDTDARLAEAALQRVSEAPAAWRPAIAQAVLGGGCPAAARGRVLEAAPREPAARSLFYLLTDQFERALDLDFDLSMLSAAYRTAEPAVRRRVAAAIRRSGDATLTRILARRQGDDFTHLTMSDVEWETLIHGLDRPERADELWSLMIDAPPVWSADIHRRLLAHGFRPPEDGRTLWDTLCSLRSRIAKADWGVLEGASAPRRRYRPPAETPVGSRVTVSGDGRIRVCNDPLGTRDYIVIEPHRSVTMTEARRFDHVALSHDGRRIAVGRNDEWRVYDVDLDRAMNQFEYAFGETWQPGVRALRFSRDGRYLAVATRHGVDVYELGNGSRVGRTQITGACLAFDEESRLLAIGGAGREVAVLEVPSMQKRHGLTEAYDVRRLDFGAGAATLAGLQDNGIVAEWSLCRTAAAAFSMSLQMKAEAQGPREAAWAWAAALLAHRRRYDIEIEDDVFVPDSTDIEIEVA